MELKVKNIDTKGVQNDSGSITVVNIVKLVGASLDGQLEATLTLKAEDPQHITNMVKMIYGTKMILELKDVDHTLDEFDTPERPLMSPAEADAHEARLAAAKVQD